MVSQFARKILLCASLPLAACCAMPAADAYYVGYNPWGPAGYAYAGQWLWPVQSLLFSVTGPAYSLANYAASPRLWYGSSGVYHPVNYWPAVNPSYMNSQTYQDPEPLNDPRTRTRPYRPTPYPSDQSVHAQWSQPVRPNYQQPAANSAPPSVLAAAPGVSSAVPATAARSAASFIARVNGKFKGNIRDALFDPDTRTWAREVGLIDSNSVFDADLSKEHVDLVKRIMQDPSLDTAHKIEAARALLKH